ncbi:YncE family protein [Danxiaibacter flavus]|uniref:YncE family protein n=1 Tax=Danxiaibacter flavus TaxID=3049108 RepID=A0ABV3ZJL7_9BACT|nr:YncE family protein [Chitinophagaceae bacterium DXS]
MKYKFFKSALAAVFIFTGLVTKAQQNDYQLKQKFYISGTGGWDYLAVNANKLYVSHGTQVDIVDKATGDSLGVIPNTDGVHGIAFIDSRNKGYTSNGKLNTITVFDLSNGKALTQIVVGQNPDAIMYEPFIKKIITCNGRSNDLSIVDPNAEKLVATIAVGGKPETAVSDGAGKLFVNIEDRNEVVCIDLKSLRVEKRWKLDPAEGPTGLAYDADAKRLFVGCEKKLVVLNASTGAIVKQITIGDGCDGVVFDRTTKTIFTSNGEGTMTVIEEKSAQEYVVKENVVTKKGARTITIDETTHSVYLPVAEYEESPSQGRHVKPGTFHVMVFKK